MSRRIRTLVRVEGIVQGVGFRPFVYTLATSLRLGGVVGNDADGVFAEVEGPAESVQEFLACLGRDAPPLASIERVTTTDLPPAGSTSFSIAPSQSGGPRRALVSADSATCPDCLAELFDPADRRFGYPFINCTNCGPRFTIVLDVPYDRPLTTMAGFTMCQRCAAEYHDPADRRFHAQPTCCPDCGPRLSLADPAGNTLRTGSPVAAAAALIARGQVLAVKGLGGYHLAVDAASEEATAALRARKHREDKPFAVMVSDLVQADRICHLDQTAQALLTSRRRPIVLVPVRSGAGIAAAVAPGNRQLGVLLPYTPLHHLLLRNVAGPIVLTSGNVSDEPIAYADTDALDRLRGIADAFLVHDRPIHVRADDSVVTVFRGRAAVLRRSRGYAPEPLTVRTRFRRPVLACGAELKSTFCLAKENRAFISQHIGDLENAETLRSFTEGIEHFCRLFEIRPAVIAHDLHPEYLSSKHADWLAQTLPGEPELTGVQHHHAHIASCLADNGLDGPVIGVAFDGTGYGTDGSIWGGEFLIADLAGFERAGHLAPVPMPGGSAAIRQPWRMAAAYLDAAYPGGPPGTLDVIRRNDRQWSAVTTMARKGINAPATSSAGRLFDAVAAILGVRDRVNYEGQAAIELEQLADASERSAYRAAIIDPRQDASPPHDPSLGDPQRHSPPPHDPPHGDPQRHSPPPHDPPPHDPQRHSPLQIAGHELVLAAVGDLVAGVDRGTIAARFHNGVAALIEDCCRALRERHGLSTVALSGGVFQNLLLLNGVVGRLEADGFTVLTHSRVPCNDGGISLGQAVVAAARDQLAQA